MKSGKLIIILILIFAVCLSGCKTKNDAETMNKPVLDISIYPDGVPVYLSLPSSVRPTDEEYFMWSEYIKEKYDITFDIKYIDYIMDMDNSMEKVDTSMGLDIEFYRNLDRKEGFIKFIDPGDLVHLIENDLILPLNEFIPEIESFASMNQRVFEQFTDPAGNIWAFPDSSNIAMSHRIYNKKWLDDSDFRTPDNIWEFLDYARYVKSNDPDNNGEDDTFIQEYSASDIPVYFNDIFAAFGCYFYYSMPVAYNPVIKKFENVVENENFRNALLYILQLKEEGLIRETGYDLILANGDSGKGYQVGSVPTSFGASDSFDEWEFGSCMSGDNETLLGLVTTPRTGFAVLKDTTNTGDIMNAIYKLTSNLTGHCDFNYGREGYNYTIDEKIINVTRVTEDNQVRYPVQMYTYYYNPTENGYFVSMDGRVDDVDMGLQQKYLKEKEQYEEMIIDTEYTYSIPFEANSVEILALNIALWDDTEKLFEGVFKRNVDIDQAIDSYLKAYNELEGVDIVSRINDQLGN